MLGSVGSSSIFLTTGGRYLFEFNCNLFFPSWHMQSSFKGRPVSRIYDTSSRTFMMSVTVLLHRSDFRLDNRSDNQWDFLWAERTSEENSRRLSTWFSFRLHPACNARSLTRSDSLTSIYLFKLDRLQSAAFAMTIAEINVSESPDASGKRLPHTEM